MKGIRFEQIYRKMPICLVGSACDDATDLELLLHLAQCEVDLSTEGHDGAITPREERIVTRWINRYR